MYPYTYTHTVPIGGQKVTAIASNALKVTLLKKCVTFSENLKQTVPFYSSVSINGKCKAPKIKNR